MIYVGSRDGRKGLGLGGVEMGETELEEGEALCYNEDEDSTMDPDIDLSYIEEKIQNVLGHFQKDFEGGVSAENLGAKFGGYGSFLPTYQRSPSWSHTRSPPEAHNYDSPRSPKKQPLEDRRQNSLASSSASPSARPRAASGKTASFGNSMPRDVLLSSKHSEQSNLKKGGGKKIMNPSDQRTLKVRIKVGSENLSTQKNAEIYSGLGLEVSPSSSMDDSPATSEGLCAKALDVPVESPTSILEIMTSFPGNLLLSPLSDELLHLTEKRKNRAKNDCNTTNKTRIPSSGVNGSVSNTRNLKASEKDDTFSIEGTASLLKKEKEADIDTLGCEELVSNALKFPLLLSSRDTISDPGTTIPKNVLKDGVKGETFSERGSLDREPTQDMDRVDKSSIKLGSSAKILESKKGNTVSSHAEDILKAENSNSSNQSRSSVSKGRKNPGAEPMGPLKQPSFQSGEGLKPDLEKSSTGGKKKQKAVHSVGADIPKDQLADDTCMSPKSAKSSQNVSKTHEFQKNNEKPGNRYKDFFGELEFEEDDNESISGSPGSLKDSQLVERKSLNEDRKTSKQQSKVKKSSEKSQPPEKYSRAGSHMMPPLGRGPSFETAMEVVPLLKEDWVQCEKCKQWRLLPLGTDPDSLPQEWLCRMLTWLPGMNRCSIPEEVTTNALRALYVPAAASIPAQASEGDQNRLKTSVLSSADVRFPDQEHQNVASTNKGKKKHGSINATSSADLDGSSHSSNSKKKLPASGNTRKLDRGNPSPQDAGGYQQMRRSVDRYDDDKKEKKVSLVNGADKGTNLKGKTKRESDLDGYRASKRNKSNEMHSGDENLHSDNGGGSSRAGLGSASGLSNITSGNDRTEAHIPFTSDDGLFHSSKLADKDSNRMRKVKEGLHSQTRAETFSSSGRRKRDSGDLVEEMSENDRRKEKKARDSGDLVEEMSENDRRKEKKARISKSGGKETSGSKSSLGTSKKSRGSKDQDYLKSDVGALQPSVAANSSSSKVSGSHKKGSALELKGSPVESVSSSPLRFPDSNNTEKVTTARKRLSGKDDFHDSGSLSAVSPRRFSGGEVGVNDQMAFVKKYQDIEIHNESASEKQSSEQCQVEEKPNNNQSQNSGSRAKKSGKGTSSHSKGTPRTSGSKLDKDKIKGSDSSHDSLQYEEKSKNRRKKLDEKSGMPDEDDKFVSKKDAAGGAISEVSKGQSQIASGGHNGLDVSKSQDKKRNNKQEHSDDKLKKKDQDEVYGGGKSISLPPLAKVQTEPVPESSHKGNGVKASDLEVSDNGDALKAPSQRKKAAENQNGQPISSKPNKCRDVEAPSPLRKDSASHAANSALKEAKDLKHLADRLKNSGSTDSIGFYFQAALKFLHGACLLESGGSDGTKHHDVMHAMHIYSSTAKLCEFCAHEYEKAKDMGSASLAYKCMEVAYLKVVYSSHPSANRDRNELQNALQIAPPGESPSSSASDIDNLNHQATTDKAAIAKVAGSPQVSGSHIISSRNRSGFLRLLNFAQDVNFAMEASKKSRIALAAAISKLGDQHKDSISSLQKALNSHFQDVEGVLRLVRIAMEAISR